MTNHHKSIQKRMTQCNTKHYKRNTLQKRIAKVMRLSNSVSVVLLLIAMIMIIGTLTSAMGMGFSFYTANQMADKWLSNMFRDYFSKVDPIYQDTDSGFIAINPSAVVEEDDPVLDPTWTTE